MINPELHQKYQITCVISGGTSIADRLALTKTIITNVLEYSVFDSKI